MTAAAPLANRYFDGDLALAEHAKLRHWLLESAEHVNDFVVDSFVHTQLIELLGPEQVRANELVAAEIMPKTAVRGRARHVVSRLLVVAATFAFVIALTYFAMFRSEVVATVTGTRNVQWGLDAEKRMVGSLLQAGDEVTLDSGTLFVTFARGGQIALHGPARLRVDSDQAGRLLRGSLSAFVPEHAVGFTVRSGDVTFIDLGTEFHLELGTYGTNELQVFDGLVEVQFDERAGNGPAKLPMPQGRAVRIDAASGGIKSIDYVKTMRLPMSAWSR